MPRQKGNKIMNKILLSLCTSIFMLTSLCDTVLARSSPIDKHSTIVSGDFAFSSSGGELYEDSEGNRVMLIQSDPCLGFFVTPGLAIAGAFMLEVFSQGDNINTAWGVGPRILFFPTALLVKSSSLIPEPDTEVIRSKEIAKGAIYPYVSVAFLYMDERRKWCGTVQEKYTQKVIKLGSGFSYMLSNTVGLTTGVSYQMDSLRPKDHGSDSGNRFNINVGFVSFLW
jgi:hypothetical protein